jgi:hypothetical protein
VWDNVLLGSQRIACSGWEEKIMVQAATLRRRSLADAAWLLVIIATLLVALAVGNTIALLAALTAALLSGWLLLRGHAPSLVSSPQVSVHIDGSARAQRSVVLADGTARQALVVPANAIEGYQTVLTINGYALVNAEGRVVYALSRESHAPASEPVVVTIMDAEMAAR